MLNVVNWDVIMTGLVVVIIVIYISHQVVRIIRMEVLHMENLRIVQNLRIQKAIIPKVIQEVQVTVIVVTHIRIIIHHIAILKKIIQQRKILSILMMKDIMMHIMMHIMIIIMTMIDMTEILVMPEE